MNITMTAKSPHWLMWEAIGAGDCNLIEELFETAFNVNDPLPNELTPLIWAIHNQKTKVVELLLKKGASVNISVSYKSASNIPWLRNSMVREAPKAYPLQIAASIQNTELIELLVDNRASADQYCGGLNGLIHIAVKHNCPKLVTKLFKLAESNDMSTIVRNRMDLTEHLILAIQRKNTKMLCHLIDLGANVNREYNGLTPLVLAANNQDLRMCFALLNSGASLNDCGSTIGSPQTPLSLAIQGGLEKAVRMLLRLGSDPSAVLDWSCASSQNTQGMRGATLPAKSSMLHLAVAKGKLDIVKMLIESGALLNHKNSIGETPLHQVVRCAQDVTSLQIARYLLTPTRKETNASDNAIDIDAQNKDGESPLILAVKCAHKDVVQLFVDSGANVMMVDKEQFGALHHAVLEYNEEILSIMLKSNANIDGHVGEAKGLSRLSPLHLAVRTGNKMFTDILIDIGADHTLLTSLGENLLHLAVMSKKSELVKDILQKRLPINKKTSSGETPLMLAARQDSSVVCQQLIDHGASLNERDHNKETALLLSVYFGFEANAKILILQGANLNLADNRKTTAIYWSIYNNRFSTLQLLMMAGAKFTKRDLLKFPKNLTVMRDEELFSWMMEYVSRVRSLQDLCRLTARAALSAHDGCGIGRLVVSLPLPPKLQHYLLSYDT